MRSEAHAGFFANPKTSSTNEMINANPALIWVSLMTASCQGVPPITSAALCRGGAYSGKVI
jgi:hypothetical protein